ncbi:uncharacterized protein LOC133784282 [Humulus lupulus]|uniref:uncharacterized protein LOC133784282 n=1 Tax=Humulus lupulus TaxID=3486 RepID=UPI002B414DBC|nr:uncharacterized protein LOC133784282 [Humulus lupulus]
MSTYPFFVVYVGRRPGVYTTWGVTHAQIFDFPGGRFEGFNSLTEALEAFRQFIRDNGGHPNIGSEEFEINLESGIRSRVVGRTIDEEDVANAYRMGMLMGVLRAESHRYDRLRERFREELAASGNLGPSNTGNDVGEGSSRRTGVTSPSGGEEKIGEGERKDPSDNGGDD